MNEATRKRLAASVATLQQKSDWTPDDVAKAQGVLAEARELQRQEDKLALKRQVDAMVPARGVAVSGPQPYPTTDLGTALQSAGWDRKSMPQAVVDNRFVLETKAASVDGDVEDTVPRRFEAAGLGADERYIFRRVRTQPVDPSSTSVTSYRQKSRSTPGDPLAAVRAIDSVVTKEEQDTVSEVFNADLKMIAYIESGVPNILLESPNFRSWVNRDLVASYRLSLDAHIVGEIDGAAIPVGGGGSNAFEDVLFTQEAVAAAGYTPNAVIVSPADALAIRLLVMAGGDSYAFAQQLPTFIVTTAVDDGAGFVADLDSLGTLFLGPFSLRAFEENAGSTNSSTVRAESSGRFVVQRADAAATLGAS